MSRHPNLLLGALLAASLALGSLVGRDVRALREAEAFYRWILAAATNERLFDRQEGQYLDSELFQSVNETVQNDLPDPPVDPNVAPDRVVSKLGLLAGNRQFDDEIWEAARSAALAPQRAEFLAHLRADQLEYAKGIPVAEAVSHGVNPFNLFFGFRKVAANFIWLQVDRYWHQGMTHRMVPLMRTTVTLDPNFVDAYLLGAWHLAYNVTAKMHDTPAPERQWHPAYKACVGEKEAYYYLGIDFLKNGIWNNPRDYKLYFDLGFAMYKNKLKDYPNAVKYLAEAVRQPHERWVPRQLYICQELNRQYAEALAGWQDYYRRFPDNETAPRFIQRNTALLHEQRADTALAAAHDAADPAEAERLRAEAARETEAARKIWESLSEEFAEARLLRIQAVQLAEQSRFLEAIALLDRARWLSGVFFDEASDMIIDYKQQGKIPLSLSERKAVLRRSEGDECQGMPPRAAAPA